MKGLRAAWRGGCVVLAFGLLNSLLSVEVVWASYQVFLRPRLSLELCLLLLLLAGWLAWRGGLRRSAPGWLAGGVVVLAVVRYVDLVVPGMMGRPVNLYWDGRHAGGVLRLVAEAMPAWQLLAWTGGLAAGLLLAWWLARWAIATLVAALASDRPSPRVVLAGLVAGFAALVLLHRPDEPGRREVFAASAAPTLARQALLLTWVAWPGQRALALGPSPAFGGNLAGLGGADVLLVFAESYGASTVDRPDQSAALASHRAALAAALTDSGRGVVSARLRAPTIGGASWLSHAALLAGIDTRDPADHDLLLTSDRPTLVRHFARQGYRTVGWMPGIKQAWPEGAFYGFDRLAADADIPYRGLPFGFWRIPDQAAMALLHTEEIAAPTATAPGRRQPRFMVFPTTTTHAPYHPVAPLVDDWARLSGPEAYSREQLAASLARQVSLQRPVQGYLDSLGYQFGWLASYLAGPAPRDLVVLIVGDHQAQGAVSGPGASWDVPVHVISNQPALLERLRARGFVTGLVPDPRGLGRLDQLTPLLLEAFDQPAAQGKELLMQGLALPGS